MSCYFLQKTVKISLLENIFTQNNKPHVKQIRFIIVWINIDDLLLFIKLRIIQHLIFLDRRERKTSFRYQFV